MRYTILIILAFLVINIHAQSPGQPVKFAGHYSAVLSEATLTLFIEPKSGSSYTGILNDGYQSLNLALELTGGTFEGVATDTSLGVEMGVTGEIKGDQIHFALILDPYGEGEDFEVNFKRDERASQATNSIIDQSQTNIDFPSGATHPQEMLGTWTKEELYQSGYGDSYMGAGTSQSMTFLSGGRMAEAGSSSYISGSDYSGQSSGEGGGIIPGVTWYTIGNQLYMQGIENGQMQQIHLGKYYVENNNMLITGTNGEKVLLTKK